MHRFGHRRFGHRFNHELGHTSVVETWAGIFRIILAGVSVPWLLEKSPS
jgi:hypothetical protein